MSAASHLHSGWASSGQNNHNTRHAAAEHVLNSANVGRLKRRWTFKTVGDISAVANVVDGVVYVPDWGGKLWAIDARTGKALWSHDVSDFGPRSTRAVEGFSGRRLILRVPCTLPMDLFRVRTA
jgi:polyvinyl alcohol dehydrogenase (cytochrome)